MISPSVSSYRTCIMFRLRQSIGFWSFWTLILRFVLQLQPLNSSEENHMRRRMYAEVRQGHTRLALVRDLAYGWPSAGIHVNGTGEARAKHGRRTGGVIKAVFGDQEVAGLAGFFWATGWIRGTFSGFSGKWSDMSEGRGEKPSIANHRGEKPSIVANRNEIVAGDLQLEPGMWKQCPRHAVWSDLYKGSAAATVKRMKKRCRYLRILGLQSSINEVAMIQESSLQ